MLTMERMILIWTQQVFASSILLMTLLPRLKFRFAKMLPQNVILNKENMPGSTLIYSFYLYMADSLKLKIKLLWVSASLLTVKWKCTITGVNVSTIGNAFQEFVMTKQESAREDKWENHALIMLNVIKHSHADPVLSGHSKLFACQWLMLGPNVKQITIVNQETSVGRRMPLTQRIRKFVLRSTQLQIKLSSNGIKTLIQ